MCQGPCTHAHQAVLIHEQGKTVVWANYSDLEIDVGEYGQAYNSLLHSKSHHPCLVHEEEV